MQSLLKLLLPVFPYVGLSHRAQLAKQPLDKGVWAMGLSPKAFIKKHGLIKNQGGSDCFDLEKATSIMQKLLGNKWRGGKYLTPARKAIFVCLCTYILGDRNKAEMMLKEISSEIDAQRESGESFQFKMSDKQVSQIMHHESIQKVIKAHAYEGTVFTTLLLLARQTGIVATSNFLWLKAFDRQLWYVLSNVGRQAVFTEGAAVHAHWSIEYHAKIAVHIPMVDAAVNALQLYYEQYFVMKDL